jgi:hypothetical protein
MARERAEGQPQTELQPVKIGGAVKSKRATPDSLPEVETQIKADASDVPEVPLNRLVTLLEAARKYVTLYPISAQVTSEMSQPEKEIRKAIEDFDIRGISEEDRFRLPVSWPESKKYTRENVMRAAGEHYSEIVVSEKVTLTATLKPEWNIDPALLTSGFNFLIHILSRIPEDQISGKTNLKVDIEPEVSQTALQNFRESGVITGEVATVTRKTPTINKPTIFQPKPPTQPEEA